MTNSRKLKTITPVEDDEPIEYSSPACYLHEFEAGRTAVGVPSVRIKRIYDEPDPADGFRVLVDRLWPRGIKKEQAARAKNLMDEKVHAAKMTGRPAEPAATPQVDVADQLRKFADLRDQGVISDEEFAAQKAKLLG